MPLYFFDFLDGVESVDAEGTECPNLNSAKVEAIRLMGEILREEAERVFSIQDCGVVVRDSQGRPLARVQTSVAAPLDTSSSSARPKERRQA